MSKGGGAGKVYFVLYLAVVLELLIIIVERDEAEEHLARKQKETMKIVESILSQLQSGAGTEGINTRPQDEITIPPPGINIKEVLGADLKPFRKYIVEVGVTDISADLKKKEGESDKDYNMRLQKLVKLANVEQIQYQVFFNPSADPAGPPQFPSETDLKKSKVDLNNIQPGQYVEAENSTGGAWEFMGSTELMLDEEGTYNSLDLKNIRPEAIQPVYPASKIKRSGSTFLPNNMPADSAFFYSQYETAKEGFDKKGGLIKRDFVVNFQPQNRAGWYKLRFVSRTNRILGIRGGLTAEDIPDDATVNIGTVQLSVKDLRSVLKELNNKLDKYNPPSQDILFKEQNIDKFTDNLSKAIQDAKNDDNATQIINNLNLYGYIVRLLAPGQSANFDQNKGSIEFDIRVITPKPQIAEPTVTIQPYIASFDKVPAAVQFSMSPYQETSNMLEGRVLNSSGAVVDRLQMQPLDQRPGSGVNPPIRGGSREYLATTGSTLSPGRYQIEIIHKLSGKQFIGKAQLEIFPTGLTKESEQEINNRLESFSFYGLSASLNAVPSSGGKIKPDQFRIYLTTDQESQRPAVNSLVISPENGLFLRPPTKSLNLRITWVQPVTENEIDIYPSKEFKVKQEEPNIIVRNLITDFSGSSSKLKISVRNIQVGKVSTGSDKDPKIELTVIGSPEIVEGLPGATASIEPTIDGDIENGFNLAMEFNTKLERGTTKLKGTIKVVLAAVAINPVNGARSDIKKVPVMINVNYEPDNNRQRRR
jgi:hypothetical protein